MFHQLTTTGDGLALQVTTPVRSAGLVEEDADGETTSRSDVVAYGFDDLIIVLDRDTERVPMGDRAELVALAASETESIHCGIDTRIRHSGNVSRVQLPATGDRLRRRRQPPVSLGTGAVGDGHVRYARRDTQATGDAAHAGARYRGECRCRHLSMTHCSI